MVFVEASVIVGATVLEAKVLIRARAIKATVLGIRHRQCG
jgi:hypothetical protein